METLEQKTPTFNPHERLYHDTTTWLAEVLDGNMRTKFEYSFDGEELYASDGSGMGHIFDKSLKDAENSASQDPRLDFEVRRRQIEKGEYQEMIEMAKGLSSNTMVVVSDFPAELKSADEDLGGYNVRRHQTMLRVINRRSDGTISVTSQSLDRSDRYGLEAIYSFFDLKPEPGELLGQRIYAEIDPDRQELLADELTREYDRALAIKYGGEYYGGRTPAEMDNTYDFVLSQTDLLGFYLSEPIEDNLRAVAATMNERFAGNSEPELYHYSKSGVRPASFSLQAEMQIAVQRAMQRGDVYSGCGVSIGFDNSADGELASLGYGSKADIKKSYQFNKKMYCVVCQPKPKETEDKKMCGPCGICKSCDAKM